MLLEASMTIMEKLLQELREADPAKREKFIEMGLNLIQMSTETLKSK